MHNNFAVSILHNELLKRALKTFGHMNAAFTNQSGKIGDTLRGVMIAADDEHFDVFLCQLRDETVKYSHCLTGRRSLLINVAGNQHSVRVFFACNGGDLCERIDLILQKGHVVERFAKVKISGVHKFHGSGSFDTSNKISIKQNLRNVKKTAALTMNQSML